MAMPQQTFEDVLIGEIRAELGRQDVTQKELARRLGWEPSAISKRFHRKVPIRAHEIEMIAEALGVSVTQLGWPFDGRSIRSIRRAS
jgi:transcriptional regulator with XRE-family HTH domain